MRVDAPVSTTPAAETAAKQKQLKQSCQQFEGILLNYMLKSMRKTTGNTDLFGSEQKESVFRDMLDSEICDRAAETQSLGIADMLYKQLSSKLESNTTDDTRGGKR